MKDNKIIRLVVVFSIAFAIRFIGINNIPFIGLVGIFLSGIIYFVWVIIRTKMKDKYYMFFAFSFIAFLLNGLIMATVDNKYPEYSSVSRPILIPMFIITLLLFFISSLTWSIKSNKKK
jgi:hypothetical protein